LASPVGSGTATEGAGVRMELLGGNPAAQAAGVDRLPGVANYLLGRAPSPCHTRIPTYAEGQHQKVYPGIGLVFYGNERPMEFDFRLAAGADPSAIRLGFAGAQSVGVDAAGDLAVQVAGQVLLQHRPVCTKKWRVSAGWWRPISRCKGSRPASPWGPTI